MINKKEILFLQGLTNLFVIGLVSISTISFFVFVTKQPFDNPIIIGSLVGAYVFEFFVLLGIEAAYYQYFTKEVKR